MRWSVKRQKIGNEMKRRLESGKWRLDFLAVVISFLLTFSSTLLGTNHLFLLSFYSTFFLSRLLSLLKPVLPVGTIVLHGCGQIMLIPRTNTVLPGIELQAFYFSVFGKRNFLLIWSTSSLNLQLLQCLKQTLRQSRTAIMSIEWEFHMLRHL